jgi:4-hydroxy-tetrahydrodipicolinate synthase
LKLIVATLTPFTRAGRIDLDALRDHIAYLLAHGVNGLAPTGTSGEFLYLNPKEKLLIHRTVLACAGDAQVIPCVWDPDVRVVAELAQQAELAGASAIFLPPPVYHPVAEPAIVAWYESVKASTGLPVLAYHHPRVSNPIHLELLETLLNQVGVAGMKDSSGDFFRLRRLARAFPGKVWGGGDELLGQIGALQDCMPGFISRFANLWPTLTLRLMRTADEGDIAELRRRIEVLKQAGGLAAMKHHLGFGNRAPLDWLDPGLLKELPPCGEG